MTAALTCQICGKYFRSTRYAKHLRDEHGIGSDKLPASPPSPPQQDVAKPNGRVVASAAKANVSRKLASIVRPQPVNTVKPPRGQRVSHRVTAALEPSTKHRNALDQIFLAPEFCLYLLLTHQPAIRTRSDAQMFLLTYKREIDGYLPLRNRSELIDLLSDFILQWSTHVPDQILLQFECQFVNNGGGAFARVRGVGDILLNNRRIRGELPRSSFELSVMIAKEQENYSIDFVYEDIQVALRTSTRFSRRAHDEDMLQVLPAQKLRSDSKKKPLTADPRKPALNRPTGPISSPRTVRTYQSRTGKSEICPLCGKSVERGGMLMHKRDFHGEAMYSPSPRRTMRRCSWVAIYQGGAPGLGKGKS